MREFEPLGDIGVDEGRKVIGRARLGLGPLLGEPLPGLGQCSTVLVSALTLATMSRGVPAGANRPNQPSEEVAGQSGLGTVAKSGKSAERADPVVPITRSVPAAMCGVTVSAGENITSIRPPRRSVTAGPVPR